MMKLNLFYSLTELLGHLIEDIKPLILIDNIESIIYNFFDDNKIYVVVQRDWDAVSECDTTEWYYDISVGEINTEHGAGVWFENRKDCEVIAFERAFIILEEKL